MPNDTSRFLLIIRRPEGHPGIASAEMAKVMGDVIAWLRQLKADGHLVATERLGHTGKIVRPNGVVSDGPFVEAKEIVGGFVMLNAPDLAAATAIARSCPPSGPVTIEVRPIEPFPPL